MKRQARRGHHGFSMVELLVTIIIAGIAFAAMVPLFVSAQEKGARAQYRTSAVNLAQDRIERLRQLPWNNVTDALVTSPPGGGLTWGTVTVGSKAFTVTLRPVANVGATQKTVTVRVTWTESGGQVGKVELTTNLFRQLPGPQVTDVGFYPAPEPASPSNGNWLTAAPIGGIYEIRATVNPAQALDCKRVKFVVIDMSGKLAPLIQFVDTPTTGTDNLFTCMQWGSGVTLHDGLYRVSVVAFSKDTNGQASLPGNTYTRDIRVERTVPDAVSFTVYPGKVSPAVVNLLWSPSTAADWDYYQVWRRLDGSPDWTLLADKVRSFGYMDTAVTAGQKYYYVVRAVDTAANTRNVGDLTSQAATPLGSGAGAAPARPTGLTASFSGATVKLNWVPPASAGSIVGYHIYRDVDADHSACTMVALAGSVTGAISYTAYDTTIAWLTPYSYTVKAFTADGVESTVADTLLGQAKDASGWATITTPAKPIYDLRMTVQGVKNGTVTVTVTDAATNTVVTTYGATKTAPSASRQLPYGNYIVSASGKSISVTLTGDPTQPVYVSLSL